MTLKAVILLSGGLDSAVTMYIARKKGYECHALMFDYGQRHRKELLFARRLARKCGAHLKVVTLHLPWKGSSLVDKTARLPSSRSVKKIKAAGIPSTYVPARNTIFLSIAASYAEAIGAPVIYIGAHADDSSGYPDCGRDYLKAFNEVLKIGTKRGLEKRLRLEFPLVGKDKSGIIRLASSLGVLFQHTWSCYEGRRRPCGKCDSCVLRAKGFKEAGIKDTLYA
ncbi:MAG: 7-cyano-7-deazaguanine synthase QueC [Candidatus Omnitrophica bacterium]|nr:7-cyano-7-deazaguanine synthase QueC [Candidatus Omnitrophota bacterium]